MKYWIIALARKDMEHCIQKGVFGMSRKHVLGHVQPGDKIACYITKERKIIAIGEATSTHFLDDSPLFLSEGLYPDRITFSAELLPTKKELDFMSIVDQMKFIKNLAYWSVYFSKSIVEISQVDWNTIKARLSQ